MVRFVPTCRICGLPSPLETASSDELGQPVHPRCYAVRIARQRLEAEYRDASNNFQRIATLFLNVEIGVATTFAALAANSCPGSEKRTIEAARRAYETVLRFRNRVGMRSKERRQIDENLKHLSRKITGLSKSRFVRTR